MVIRPLLGLVVLVGLGYGGLQVLSQLQQQPASRVPEGRAPLVVTPLAAQSFDDKLGAMERAAADAKRTGRATPVEVTFTEQELTSKLAQMTFSGAGGLVARDTQVHLTGGSVVATSRVNVQGFDLSVGIVAVPVVEAGQAKLVITEVRTGAVTLPDALKRQIQAQLGQAIDPSALGLPFEVTKVQILDGKVVIAGTAKP